MSTLSRDVRAVVEAVDRLTTQVKRLADAKSTPVAVAADAPTTTADDGPCAQHPNAPTFDGMCGGCTQYPADFPARVIRHWGPLSEQQFAEMRDDTRQLMDVISERARRTLAADEDTQRTTRRERLHNLLARADRSTLTPGEVAALRDLVDAEVREADTARAVAAGNKRHVQLLAPEPDDLQARITKARALHASHAYGSAECTQRCERRHPEVRVCNGCGWTAPCPTIRALDGTEQPTT